MPNIHNSKKWYFFLKRERETILGYVFPYSLKKKKKKIYSSYGAKNDLFIIKNTKN